MVPPVGSTAPPVRRAARQGGVEGREQQRGDGDGPPARTAEGPQLRVRAEAAARAVDVVEDAAHGVGGRGQVGRVVDDHAGGGAELPPAGGGARRGGDRGAHDPPLAATGGCWVNWGVVSGAGEALAAGVGRRALRARRALGGGRGGRRAGGGGAGVRGHVRGPPGQGGERAGHAQCADGGPGGGTADEAVAVAAVGAARSACGDLVGSMGGTVRMGPERGPQRGVSAR